MKIKDNFYIRWHFINVDLFDSFELNNKTFVKIPETTLKNDTKSNAYCITDDEYSYISPSTKVNIAYPCDSGALFQHVDIGDVFIYQHLPYLKVSNDRVFCLKSNICKCFSNDIMVFPIESTITLEDKEKR